MSLDNYWLQKMSDCDDQPAVIRAEAGSTSDDTAVAATPFTLTGDMMPTPPCYRMKSNAT